MALFKNGAFVNDAWHSGPAADADGTTAAPAPGTILSLAEWLAIRDTDEGRNAPRGVRLEAGESIEALIPDLPRLALVALVFPKFNDGRSFSKARLLRGTHGFTGEIRAVGEVLWDQLQLMRRCGFDAFEITNEPTLRALRAGKVPVMTEFYQPGLSAETREGAPARRPWARQALS